MSNFDRQLTNALDRLHLDIQGGRLDPHCRWFYDSKSDIYHCPHTAVYGKDLMARMPAWSGFINTPAQVAWDNKEHPL